MNKIQDDQFVTVHGWMRTQLGLKANELWLYALIYSFNKATKKDDRDTIAAVLDRIVGMTYEVPLNGKSFRRK